MAHRSFLKLMMSWNWETSMKSGWHKRLVLNALVKSGKVMLSASLVVMTNKASQWNKVSWQMAEWNFSWKRGSLATGQEGREKESASQYVDALLMRTSASWTCASWRKVNKRSLDWLTELFQEDWDQNELVGRFTCFNFFFVVYIYIYFYRFWDILWEFTGDIFNGLSINTQNLLVSSLKWDLSLPNLLIFFLRKLIIFVISNSRSGCSILILVLGKTCQISND